MPLALAHPPSLPSLLDQSAAFERKYRHTSYRDIPADELSRQRERDILTWQAQDQALTGDEREYFHLRSYPSLNDVESRRLSELHQKIYGLAHRPEKCPAVFGQADAQEQKHRPEKCPAVFGQADAQEQKHRPEKGPAVFGQADAQEQRASAHPQAQKAA